MTTFNDRVHFNANHSRCAECNPLVEHPYRPGIMVRRWDLDTAAWFKYMTGQDLLN